VDYSSRRTLISTFLLGSVAADLYALKSGLNFKLFFGYLSTAITLAGYAFYISQMYPGRGQQPVKPEPLSWTFFGFLTASGWIVQVAQGAQAGSWCLGVTAVACFVIAGWSYFKFTWQFGRSHILYSLFAIALFGFSLLTKGNPEWATVSATMATLADLVSYGPTFQRALHNPHEDSPINFTFNSVKCIPALLALESYSIATTIFLLMLAAVNGGFALFLVIRQRQLEHVQSRDHNHVSGK
jgi:hypothetical protein